MVDSEQASSAASQALRVLSNLLAGNAISQTVAVEDVIPTVVVLLKATLTAPNGQHVHLLIKVGTVIYLQKGTVILCNAHMFYKTGVNWFCCLF